VIPERRLWRTIALDRGDHGTRVDLVLLRHLRDERGASRNRIQQLIAAGDVLVNGRPAPRPAWRIQAGDDLRVRIESATPRAKPAAQPIPLDVLYEDEDLLALNKPAGLVVHPSYKNAGGTLINGVLERAKAWAPGDRPGLLGRLDKQTSGVVLVTKRPAIHAALQAAMDARRVDKEYLAVVWGKPTPQRGTIDLALDRDPWDRRRITVTDRGGQPSVTRYERLASSIAVTAIGGPGFSLVRCRLITGRTHQIRVHLSARGWPIVGDAVYGRKTRVPRGAPEAPVDARLVAGPAAAPSAFPRQALHAWRLSFRHPTSGVRMEISAPLPDDITALLDAIGLAGRLNPLEK
jgi:23S rRNA pseudouridine1911/1915/1917 synthase